jgi:LssY C-terminus
MIRASLLSFLLVASALAQTKEVDLKPADGWVDSGIDLNAGDSIKVTATGELQYSNAKQSNGPEGLPRGWADLVRNLQFNDGGRGALIGRIGNNDAARAFLIGADLTSKAPIAGHLYIAINQTSGDQATGSYHVTIKRTAAAAGAIKTDVNVPPFTQKMIDDIPRRVVDAEGNPGDRVNFVLIGSKEEVQSALKTAGWVLVDRTNQDAVLNGLLTSLSKQAYVTMPMSVLDLWGRGQDFGYAQADPVQVVASRHHFRIWKAPFDLKGRTVWAGAGMHDIGFARDDRTKNGITHKIDPNSDAERDYIRDSLVQTGMVVKTDYITPTDPVTRAKTATGSEFTSDGRTLIVYLAEIKEQASAN